MSFWADLVAYLRPARKALSIIDLMGAFAGLRRSKSGVSVTWQSALQVSTVLACARVIAEGIAQAPLKLFEESPDGRRREPAKDHPLYHLLHRRPNRWQTSFEFRETMALHLVLAGDAFAFKNRIRGQVRELIQFAPEHVVVHRDPGGEPTYKVVNPQTGTEHSFGAEDIWHVRGPSWSGHLGLNAVELAREAIGLALATEGTHAQFHANGAQTSGVYSVDGVLTDKQFEALQAWISRYAAGGDLRSAPMILDRGAKWHAQAMSGVDAQHLETRRFQIEEICRALRVMPIMVGYSDKASTYASAEQMFLAHVVHTLAPWYERIEQSISAGLLTEADARAGIYPKFITAGLLRGSLRETKDTILGYVNGGVMTPNEGRALLELNPDDDEASDELRIPTNIVGEPKDEPVGDPPADPKKGD